MLRSPGIPKRKDTRLHKDGYCNDMAEYIRYAGRLMDTSLCLPPGVLSQKLADTTDTVLVVPLSERWYNCLNTFRMLNVLGTLHRSPIALADTRNTPVTHCSIPTHYPTATYSSDGRTLWRVP
jgi:hypothetical protein